MTYEILDQYKLINGTTNSSFGPLNAFGNGKSDELVLNFLESRGFPSFSKENLIFAEQTHGPEIYECQKNDGGKVIQEVDALITSHKNQILSVKTADCVPLLIYEPEKEVVAAIHAGRRSLTAEIIKKTISKMKKSYGISGRNLKIAIGPHIRKNEYFLKPKALENLQKTEWEKYFKNIDSRIYFDLTQATFDQLTEAGVSKENIEDCGICTFSQYQQYYSARKKEQNPSVYREIFPCFANLIGMAKNKIKN